jgi:hypothetical protein
MTKHPLPKKMKKIDILEKKLQDAETAMQAVSIERKDTSYRRPGGYYGTNNAYTDDVIIVKTIARTKHLNTYVCVSPENKQVADAYFSAKEAVKKERERLFKVAQNKWAKESIQKAIDYTERQIADGTIKTNYAKMFFVGNRNIYVCHPCFGHEDYNKGRIMPNTPKHRKIAEMLNQKLIAAGLNF